MRPASQITGEVMIPVGRVQLYGDLAAPGNATGIVAFAHGSGSGRHSPRNQFVAEHLRGQGLATLLMDLLTQDEEQIDLRTRHLRFDIGLLAERLEGAARWLADNPATAALKAGYFGASTGGGAALVAAAHAPELCGAVVSRGGRPDLAGDALPGVRAATLLIVGGRDEQVIELNERAFAHLRCEKQLVIVPGATHLFEEPGTLDRVAELAAEWFVRHLPADRR